MHRRRRLTLSPTVLSPTVVAVATTIRTANADDADAIAGVHVAAWQRGYAGLLPADLLAALSVPERAEGWRRHFASAGEVWVWVAGDVDGQVQGFASIGLSRDADAPTGSGELYTIYVHPQCWSTGVGKKLLATAVETLASRFVTATLWVLEGNSRARQFYQAQGWQLDGARKTAEGGQAFLNEVRYRLGPPNTP